MPAFRPNWCTSVMGTAIVAVVASVFAAHAGVAHAPVARLAVDVPGVQTLGSWLVPVAHAVAVAAWLLSASALAVQAALGAPGLAGGAVRRFADDPHTAPFLGAVPMAMCTVAAATATAGATVLGAHAALVVAVALWVPGTVLSCVCAVGLPLHATRRVALRGDPGHPTWVLAAVPPLTAANTGVVFAPHLAAGGPRDAFVALSALLLALGVAGAAAAVLLVARRVQRVGLGPARSLPTLWIVLGPFGQTTAALVSLVAAAGAAAGPAPTTVAIAVWGTAIGGLTFLLPVTVRAARRGMPFSLAWWSFTFPVGMVALGAADLARSTGDAAFGVAAVALLGLLLVGWALAAGGTARYAGLRLAGRKPSAAVAAVSARP